MRKHTLLFVLALALVVPSCNRETPRAGDRKTVALVLKTLNHPFFVDMRRGAQEAADRAGSPSTSSAACPWRWC